MSAFDRFVEQQQKMSCESKTFKFPFMVKTVDRVFVLFAPSYSEREMWIAGFNYVIVSTNQVQSLLKENEQNLKDKMRMRTIEINEKAELSARKQR